MRKSNADILHGYTMESDGIGSRLKPTVTLSFISVSDVVPYEDEILSRVRCVAPESVIIFDFKAELRTELLGALNRAVWGVLRDTSLLQHKATYSSSDDSEELRKNSSFDSSSVERR